MYKITFHTLLAPLMIIVCLLAWCAPAAAISIKEEEQLSREFLKVLKRHFELIEDPLINRYVNDVGRKLLAVLPHQPFSYHFYVIKEDVFNAFAIPAGHIFVNSGLLMAMDSEEELAGILSHEISHVVCRHVAQRIDRSKKIDLATMAGVVAGIFLGAAAGGPAIAQGLIIGSAAAGQSLSLAFSRDDEAQADQMGLVNLAKAGYSAQGLLAILNKIRSRQWFGSDQVPTYLMTHPAVEQRIVDIDGWIASHKTSGSDLPVSGQPAPLFQKVVLRLRALYGETGTSLQFFQTALAQNPSDAGLTYGYGLLLARMGRRAEAETHLRHAMARDALDPVILSDLGRIYFLDGRFEEALGVLQGAVSLTGNNPESLFYLGRTRMELGQYYAAATHFEALLQDNPDYLQAYYFLGESCGKLDRMPEAHYYLGMFHYNKGEYKLALHHLVKTEQSALAPDKLATAKEALEDIRKMAKKKEF